MSPGHERNTFPLSVVIQAGGRSTRMGEDKALAPFRGMTLIEYILQQIGELGDETLIIANQPEAYERFGLPVKTDVIPDLGALGGLYSAIYHASHQRCLLLACDMPFVNRPLLDYLISLSSEYDIAIPRLKPEEFAEPFRAVYKKSCLPPIKNALDEGQRKLISFFGQMKVRYVDSSEIAQFDPQFRSFFNVNTPEDLAEAERMADDSG